MSELKINEAGSVQFPLVAHAAAIGWTAISIEIAKQKRGGQTACCSATSGRRPLRQVQAHAGQIAAAGMVGSRLHGECG